MAHMQSGMFVQRAIRMPADEQELLHVWRGSSSRGIIMPFAARIKQQPRKWAKQQLIELVSNLRLKIFNLAPVAQRIMQQPSKLSVVGSNPARGAGTI
jgi:hypothetical protein